MPLKIDQFLQPDGTYTMPIDGVPCTFETATDLYGDLLGFCGCGDHESALQHVLGALRLVKKIKDDVWSKKTTFDEFHVEEDAYFGNRGVKYFTWYFLSDKKLIEHGGSVPGWLTEKGEDYLHDLEIICAGFEKC